MVYTTLLDVRQHLARKLQIAETRARGHARAPPSPAEKEPTICHSASRPRQPGITGSPLKWHGKEPEVRIDVEFGADQALAVFAAGLVNLGDAVEHQHRRQRQLRVAGRTARPRPQASRSS